MKVDPNWTLEEAQAANEEARKRNCEEAYKHGQSGGWESPTLPLYQWFALQKLKALESSYEGGHKNSLLIAIRVCAVHGLVMPQWVAMGYIRAFDAKSGFCAKDLNEAFGLPPAKGGEKTLKTKRRRVFNTFLVWNRVAELSKMGEPIDEGLFEKVGKELEISGSTARDCYYRAKKSFQR